jgi:hypothetical protein
MTRAGESRFPELRRVLAGYLHEDFLLEAGTPQAALRAYLDEASPAERRRFQRDVARFLAHIATLDFAAARDLFNELGSRWVPPSHEALVALLTDAARPGGTSPE